MIAPILTATPHAVRVDYAPGRAVIVTTAPADRPADPLTTDTFHLARRAAEVVGQGILYRRRLAESADGRRATFGTRARWENVADAAHPLAGTVATWAPTPPPGGWGEPDPADAGHVILYPGDRVDVRAVFRHWGGPSGPTLALVRSHTTGESTHVPVTEVAAD